MTITPREASLLASLTQEQGLRHTFEEAAHALELDRDGLKTQVDRLKWTLQAEVWRLEADVLRERERNSVAQKWARRWKAAAWRSRRWTNRFARMALRLARRPGKTTDADPK
jgi:SMC interacting uncharacterized protein involved in chromosome segregation